MKAHALPFLFMACVDGPHPGAVAATSVDAPELADAAPDHVRAIASGATGVCAHWASGRVTCGAQEIAPAAHAFAAAGTQIWHHELLGCALDEAGVACASELIAYRFDTPSRPRLIALGDHAGAVALDDGQVLTWAPLVAEPRPAPVVVDVPDALTCGFDFCCALADGQVTCWGDHVPEVPAPGVDAIAAGMYHLCALADGVVTCTGREDVAVAPRLPDPAEPVLELEAGGWVTCVRGASTFACVASGEPIAITFSDEVVQLDVGGSVCALLANGEVDCPGWY